MQGLISSRTEGGGTGDGDESQAAWTAPDGGPRPGILHQLHAGDRTETVGLRHWICHGQAQADQRAATPAALGLTPGQKIQHPVHQGAGAAPGRTVPAADHLSQLPQDPRGEAGSRTGSCRTFPCPHRVDTAG